MKAVRKLTLYETYSRQDVYDIFEGSARSRPIVGAWSLWPVLQVTNNSNNFVFFVTLDQEQVGHPIAEWVTKEGMFNWQSQPQKSLADWQIKQFIHHDANVNDIYLFLRTDKTSLYTYIGRLAYLKHTPEQERPVIIQWQILDWNPPPNLLRSLHMILHSDNSRTSPGVKNIAPKEKAVQARIPILYNRYSRQEVHDLLEPSTRFTPQAGTWGLWGIIPIIQKPGNFVFFVTFGKEQAGYHFDEWINERGVINWQSQPRQGLDDHKIQQFIHHDPTKNDIYLFLRTQKSDLYTYFGKLAYFSHDSKFEKPVHIQWQILEWAPSPELLKSIALKLLSEEPQPTSQPTDQGSFEWRGVQYPADREEIQNRIRKQIVAGLPFEATRFRDWFVYMCGERLSPKWVIHLITGADYSEFDAPMAREKLQKLGIKSYQINQSSQITVDGLPQEESSGDGVNKHKLPGEEMDKEKKSTEISVPTYPPLRIAETKQPLLISIPPEGISPGAYIRPKLPEKRIGAKNKFISSAIQRLTNLIFDLERVGEISSKALSTYGITDSHLLQLHKSSWVISTPYAIVATPRLLNLLPIENMDKLNELLHLTNWDYRGWSDFDLWAYGLHVDQRYANLGFDYIYTPKTNSIADENIWRPAWLVNYLSDIDWDDWEISSLMKENNLIFTESKYHVHSSLPIQNIYGGIPEVQDAAWKTSFYWLMLQLLILSDPETGSVYDPRISLTLSDGWRDGSIARLFLQDDYIGDLAVNLETLLSPFKWVWVNRSQGDYQDKQSVLGLLRLLLKIDIAKLGNEGRLQFTDSYRRELFQSQAKAQFYYRSSKEARDKLRDTIKEMGG